jgi:hypothetical protein
VSETAAKTGMRALAEEGLAVRVAGGWVRGPADPKAVAKRLGVYERVDAIVDGYREDRKLWRRFLKIVEAAFGPDPDDDGADDMPEEVLAVLGPPAWVGAEPHAPPR